MQRVNRSIELRFKSIKYRYRYIRCRK